MDTDEGPLLEWTGDVDESWPDPDEQDQLASNDEWAFQQAEFMVSRLPKHAGKDRRTEGEVFDHQTLMTLHKLLSHGVLRSLDFPVSTGKEANVFRGTTPEGGLVAVKIFRTNTATFKHVLGYIQGDERFQGVTGDKRSLVHAWTQKEFRNLHRMRDAGVDVPEPLKVLNNVLVMEYLGTEEGPWPALKDLGRLEKHAERFHKKLHQDFINITNKANLVHGDLSEYNILVENVDKMVSKPKLVKPRIIDVGQAVLRSHPMSREYLDRDIRNFTNYFKRQRLKITEQDLQRDIT